MGCPLAWDSSAPPGITAHQPPFRCAHTCLCPWLSSRGSCTAMALLPTSSCLQPSGAGVCTHFPLLHPKGALSAKCFYSQHRIPSPDPALWGYFTSPLSVHTSPHPCNVKVKLGPAGHCPGVTALLGGADHAAPGVRVLPCLGAVRLSTASATPALVRHGVNRFRTGTSSCRYWELEDWNSPHVHGASWSPRVRYFPALELESEINGFHFSSEVPTAASALSWLGKGWVMLPGFRSSFPV